MKAPSKTPTEFSSTIFGMMLLGSGLAMCVGAVVLTCQAIEDLGAGSLFSWLGLAGRGVTAALLGGFGMGMLGLGILLFIFPSKESGKRNTPALARGILSHGNTNVFLAFPVLAWLLVSAAITAKCLHLLATSSPIPIPVWIWLVPVSGIAGGVWLWRLWQDLQQWPSRTLMLQSPVRLGGPFEGFIEGNERLALTGEYRLQLACLVNTKEDSDGLRIHPSQVVWETEQTLGRDRLDETGPEKRIPFRFELPATLPPGPFPADIVKDYSWQLTAKVRIAGKRWEDSFSGALPGVVAGQPTPERIP